MFKQNRIPQINVIYHMQSNQKEVVVPEKISTNL